MAILLYARVTLNHSGPIFRSLLAICNIYFSKLKGMPTLSVESTLWKVGFVSLLKLGSTQQANNVLPLGRLCHMDLAMHKRVFEHMRTAKAQISLDIRAVWSGLSLSANKSAGQNVSIERKCPDKNLCMRGMNLNLCTFSLDASFLIAAVFWFFLCFFFFFFLLFFFPAIQTWLVVLESKQEDKKKKKKKKKKNFSLDEKWLKIC